MRLMVRVEEEAVEAVPQMELEHLAQVEFESAVEEER